MSDRILAKGDDMLSNEAPEGPAITMEAESFSVIKPSITLTSNSGLKEEELCSEVDVPSAGSRQYFSTPVQSERKRWASALLDLQGNPLGYKSFFSLECDEIIHQLQSKAAQGWSASKRKLEELDISTIEAEPLPLLCCTPSSVLDETTCSAKRRKIDDQGDGHISLDSCLPKHNSPGHRTSLVQDPEKVHGLNPCRKGDRNSIQENSSPHITFENHSKRNLFLKSSRTAHLHSNLPTIGEKTVPEESKSGTCSPLLCVRIHNKINFQNYESPTAALEFRSFFAEECEKICNQLKRPDTERIMFGNVSSIEAEVPPVLSATNNSSIILELSSTRKENSAMGVSQLDLEKMNINYSITERAFHLQMASDTVPCNSKTTGPKEKVIVTDTAQDRLKTYELASLANTTQDVYNEASGDGAMPEIKLVPSQFPIVDLTQDISIMHDVVTEANITQGIEKMHGNGPPSVQQANVTECERMSLPCIMQDIVKVHDKVSIANATQDITVCDDVSIVNGTQVIVAVGDWPPMNAIQDNLITCSKMPLPVTESSDDSVANETRDIGVICNEAPAVEVMQNIGTLCSPADATQEVMGMFSDACVANATQQMTTEKLSEVNVTVDIGTVWGSETDPEDTNRLHVCSEIPAQRDIVIVDTPLQNVTLIKSGENVVNYFQNIVSNKYEMTLDSAINKTFTQCKMTEPNVTHDLSVNRGTETNVQDLTQLISCKDAPNISKDISIIAEKPKINATQTLLSVCKEATSNESLQDSCDLTKVIATNCTMLDNLSKNVCNQINEPEKQNKHIWPITALAHSSPMRGNMCNIKDSTYNLDLTDIAYDESVFYNRPIPFITSTPLPSLGNNVFIKKSCGLPVKSKPSVQQDNINKVVLAQRQTMPQLSVTGQSLGGDPRTRVGTSQGVQDLNITKIVTPQIMESRMPQPAPRSTPALSVLKTPQTVKAVLSRKEQVALRGTNIKPPLVPTSLPRKNMKYGQPCKSGAPSGILQQQTPVNCIRAGKDFFKKRIDVSKFPASSLVRPPFGLSTPSSQICAGKVQSICGPQNAAPVCKASTVLPSSVTARSDPSGSIRQEHTFIRPTNPVAPQIFSKIKPRVSGLPVRKSQETFLKPISK